MPTPVSNVYPGSTTYTHEVALKRPNGQVWGLRIAQPPNDASPQTKPPSSSVKQYSFHLGRGWESMLQQHMGYWDAKDAWTLTSGKLHPAPLMQWGRGIRYQDMNWLQTGVQTEYTNIVWKKIGTGGDPYLSVSFSATGFSGTHLQFFVRRKGNPGTLTVEVVSDSTGNPTGTVLQTVTVTKTDVTDTPVVLYDGEPSSYTFVAATTYHVKFRSSDTDGNNCWEIGCNPDLAGKRSTDDTTYTATTYSPYFRITDADISGRIIPFMFDGAMYAVDVLDSGGTSTLWINGGRGKATSATSTTLVDTALNMTADRYINAYIHIIRGTGAGQTRKITDNDATSFTVAAWTVTPDNTSEYVVYGTPWFHTVGATGINGFTSAAVGSTGLGGVTSAPAVINRIVYFPQGDSTGIRRMRWNSSTKVHDFATETATGYQGCAYYLEAGYDPADGPQLWRANNSTATGSGGAQTVSRADGTVWGTALAFRLPNTTKGIYIGSTSTNITGLKFHDGVVFVHKENGLFTVERDRAIERKYGANDMPSTYNGSMMLSNGAFLYLSFWTNIMQFAGGSVSDTKLWLNNLPSGRVGNAVDGKAAFGWTFFAYDAGSGTSSVLAWNNDYQAFHEILRGFETGRRIRGVFWQPCEDTNPRLWTNIGGELVFQVFPRSPRPLADDTIVYQPEFVFETSTIDLFNSNSKFFGTLSMTTKNLSQSGHFIEVDYQADNDINSSTWLSVPSIVLSPEQSTKISTGNKRKIRMRFRGLAQDLTVPPVVENFGLTYFEKQAPPTYFTISCLTSPNQKVKNIGANDHAPSELLTALQQMANSAEPLTMLSIDPEMHNRSATMYLAPNVIKEEYNFLGKWSGRITVYLFSEAQNA